MQRAHDLSFKLIVNLTESQRLTQHIYTYKLYICYFTVHINLILKLNKSNSYVTIIVIIAIDVVITHGPLKHTDMLMVCFYMFFFL